jgi:hypothetical protein
MYALLHSKLLTAATVAAANAKYDRDRRWSMMGSCVLG